MGPTSTTELFTRASSSPSFVSLLYTTPASTSLKIFKKQFIKKVKFDFHQLVWDKDYYSKKSLVKPMIG
tara:strand:- start:2815 stop:3021 length:207 start_codon:yes stop_codon:yes gene_type:complete